MFAANIVSYMQMNVCDVKKEQQNNHSYCSVVNDD